MKRRVGLALPAAPRIMLSFNSDKVRSVILAENGAVRRRRQADRFGNPRGASSLCLYLGLVAVRVASVIHEPLSLASVPGFPAPRLPALRSPGITPREGCTPLSRVRSSGPTAAAPASCTKARQVLGRDPHELIVHRAHPGRSWLGLRGAAAATVAAGPLGHLGLVGGLEL
jgi:hypothetical protein